MLKKTLPIIFLIIQLAAEALLIFAMATSDMFPMSYIVAAAVFGVILMLLAAALDFFRIDDKSENSVIARRVVAIVLAIMILVIAIFAYLVMNKVGDTVSSITENNKTVTKAIGVYVLKDDPAKTIGDAAYYAFGYETNFSVDNIQNAISDINSKISREIDADTYEDAMEMMKDFYSGRIDAIIMDESYASIIEDQDEYADFADETKIIYEYEIVSEANNKKNNGDLSSFVVYISGSDTRSKKLSVSRSDVNILMAVNTKTKEILLLNTPRDYYVPISRSSNGTRDKLTHCGIYGIDCSMDTLSAFYGQNIDYYAQINFTGFKTLVDAIGGVSVYADTGFSAGGVTINKGENYLHGREALVFARDRHHQAGGDRGRGENQMKVIAALVNKLSAGTILANYSDILNSLQGMFVTDMSSEQINTLIKMQLSDMASWNIHSYAVTGSDGSNVTYSMPGTHCYVMYPNQQMVDHASDLMGRVLAGEKLTDKDVE